MLLCDCRFCDVDFGLKDKENTATFSLGDIIVQNKKSNVASPLFPLSLSCTVIHGSEHKDYTFFSGASVMFLIPSEPFCISPVVGVSSAYMNQQD